MAKYCGNIGFVETIETSPGVWTEDITERQYRGDVISDTRRWEAGEYLNDNLVINNKISIISDPYAYRNFFAIRYVDWMGARWKVTNVEIARPRLILSLGGVYNGSTT